MVQFRKSKKFGPVRLTASKKGLGVSMGAGPLRLSRGADGRTRRTVRVPGTGIYDTKVVGGSKSRKKPKAGPTPVASGAVSTPPPTQRPPRKPWFKRRWVWGVGAFVLFVALLGGDPEEEAATDSDRPTSSASAEPTTTTPPASTPRPSASRPAAPPAPARETEPRETEPRETEPRKTEQGPQAWADAPEDGTWDYGDASFGEWSDNIGSREYSARITEPPTLTTTDGGRSVTVTSRIELNRVEDRGFGDPISGGVPIFWEPGERDESNRMNEAYAINPEVECEEDNISAGETTTCTVSFTTRYPEEVPNSYWEVHGLRIGTWPSQIAND